MEKRSVHRLPFFVGFSPTQHKASRVFLTTPRVSRPLSPLGLSEFSETQKKFPEMIRVTGYGRILKCPLTGYTLQSSPFGIPNGFGEDIVSPVQIHDPVLQVEFPFVLTSVNLENRGTEINVVGVKDGRTLFQFRWTRCLMFFTRTHRAQPEAVIRYCQGKQESR